MEIMKVMKEIIGGSKPGMQKRLAENIIFIYQ